MWRRSVGRSHNILSVDHGIVGRTIINYKSSVQHAVCDYVETNAVTDGHALPIHMRRADRQYVDVCFDTNPVIVPPPPAAQHHVTL